MAKTNKCNGCSKCVQGGLGKFAKKVGNAGLIVGTLGASKVVSMVANANERNCVFCGHRLEFHEKDSHGQYIR
jgi:hypothetical protein